MNKVWKELRELIMIVGVVVLVQTQICAQSYVPSGSMEPTIHPGDRLIINKLATHYKSVETGDIVVFLKERKFPLNEYWIKRVIGLPGQVVDIREGAVYIDGVVLEEGYTQGETYAILGEVTFPYSVPEGHYFVMGDNRERSRDSRYLGAIPEQDIVAIGGMKIYPFDAIETLK